MVSYFDRLYYIQYKIKGKTTARLLKCDALFFQDWNRIPFVLAHLSPIKNYGCATLIHSNWPTRSNKKDCKKDILARQSWNKVNPTTSSHSSQQLRIKQIYRKQITAKMRIINPVLLERSQKLFSSIHVSGCQRSTGWGKSEHANYYMLTGWTQDAELEKFSVL